VLAAEAGVFQCPQQLVQTSRRERLFYKELVRLAMTAGLLWLHKEQLQLIIWVISPPALAVAAVAAVLIIKAPRLFHQKALFPGSQDFQVRLDMAAVVAVVLVMLLALVPAHRDHQQAILVIMQQ
jgi:carbon starvation protein CstA